MSKNPLFSKQLPSCIFSGTRINFVLTRQRDKICIQFFVRSLYVYFEVLKILVKAEKIHQNAAILKDDFMGKLQLLGLTRNFLGLFWLTDSEINFLRCFSNTRGCGNSSRENKHSHSTNWINSTRNTYVSNNISNWLKTVFKNRKKSS